MAEPFASEALLSRFSNLYKFNLEDKRRVRRNGTDGPRAVAERRRNDDDARTAHLHALDALRKAGNDFTEREYLSAAMVRRLVEGSTVLELADVIDRYRSSRPRHGAGAGRNLLNNDLLRRCRRLRYHADFRTKRIAKEEIPDEPESDRHRHRGGQCFSCHPVSSFKKIIFLLSSAEHGSPIPLSTCQNAANDQRDHAP